MIYDIIIIIKEKIKIIKYFIDKIKKIMKKLLSSIKFFFFNKVNKTNIKKSFGFNRINEINKERSYFSFEGEIKEKPQSSSLKQGVDYLNL